ncbi:peptidylglycine alpha-amidating monooxygenase [Pendulispora rubella]|uniref:Peptidylglycine alpha-amidating monooxygenase n=1 Tax=Pendulispora rubella TaxID=2741070 RepID=A0ABZ2LDR6_9BACT
MRCLAFLASFAASIALGTLAASCSDSPSPPVVDAAVDANLDAGDGAAATLGLPCAVDSVLARNCRSCHSNPPQFGAPMSLVSWEDLQATSPVDSSAKIYQRVGVRIHNDDDPMPKPPNPRLGIADLAILDDYIATGAPRSGNSCTAVGADGGPVPLDCTPDVHMLPKSRWTMPKDRPDEYVCYGFDIAQATKRHGIAFAPKIDNTRLVHHVVLFQSDEPVDATPHACSPVGSIAWRLVFGWAPGGQNLLLPPEAGFPLEGTSHYVAQIHYNNATGLEGESDGSGFDMCTTSDLRRYDADVMAFGSQNFEIPRQSRHDVNCTFTVPSSFQEVHTFSVMPHMHKLGRALVNTLYPANEPGKPVDMGAQSTFDFNNQVWMRIDATLRPGDLVKTRCAWTNTTQYDVSFGQNTEDEMCYAFTMYYPRIDNSGWTWALPAAAARCAKAE